MESTHSEANNMLLTVSQNSSNMVGNQAIMMDLAQTNKTERAKNLPTKSSITGTEVSYNSLRSQQKSNTALRLKVDMLR